MAGPSLPPAPSPPDNGREEELEGNPPPYPLPLWGGGREERAGGGQNVVAVGVDLTDVPRIRKALGEFPERFVKRILTKSEAALIVLVFYCCAYFLAQVAKYLHRLKTNTTRFKKTLRQFKQRTISRYQRLILRGWIRQTRQTFVGIRFLKIKT